MRYSRADVWRFMISQDNLQLQELPKIPNSVEMYPGTTDQEESALFNDPTSDTIGKAQYLPQCVGVVSRGSNVEGLLRTQSVGPTVDDDLSQSIRERPLLEPSCLAQEERVILEYLGWARCRDSCYTRHKR